MEEGSVGDFTVTGGEDVRGVTSPLFTQTGQFRTGASRALYSLGLYLKPSVGRLHCASDNGDREAPKWRCASGVGRRLGFLLKKVHSREFTAEQQGVAPGFPWGCLAGGLLAVWEKC